VCFFRAIAIGKMSLVVPEAGLVAALGGVILIAAG
jgi:hypothetical protein